MDQLDSKAQDVLYTIFEWPYLPQSRLCLIGIANALDLTHRILPRLQAQPHFRPLLLHFPPYSRQELATIIQDRLTKVTEGMLDTSAVQFCARKVSAVSGDARKALDICRVPAVCQMVGCITVALNSLFLQVFLKIQEKDVENALKDRTLLGSILAAGLPS
ncbi:AAA ATPase [Goodea atripinnis]|uniref:AAA ATPase n=1 Tax=Goodea atripinnis TaxID=208336 RepID=A0ABV0MWP2_9TELE